jgi:hypothetical protein
LKVPLLTQAISEGKFGVSVARKLLPVLEKDPGAWIRIASEVTKEKLEQMVADENPKKAIGEKVTYKGKGVMELTFGLETDIMLKFRQAQTILCNQKLRVVNLEETLSEVLDQFIDREDPLEKSKRAKARKPKSKKEPGPGNNSSGQTNSESPVSGQKTEVSEESAEPAKERVVPGQQNHDSSQ